MKQGTFGVDLQLVAEVAQLEEVDIATIVIISVIDHNHGGGQGNNRGRGGFARRGGRSNYNNVGHSRDVHYTDMEEEVYYTDENETIQASLT